MKGTENNMNPFDGKWEFAGCYKNKPMYRLPQYLPRVAKYNGYSPVMIYYAGNKHHSLLIYLCNVRRDATEHDHGYGIDHCEATGSEYYNSNAVMASCSLFDAKIDEIDFNSNNTLINMSQLISGGFKIFTFWVAIFELFFCVCFVFSSLRK